MTDHKNLNALILGLKGWEPARLSFPGCEVTVLVDPYESLDGYFHAFDLEEGVIVEFKGWMLENVTFEASTVTEAFA